ncbi:MAG: NAD-glutamate dehydrogenase [Rhizobiales bacterium 65-79]|jgi:glutamate dehydrogenase|nr:NAD-glutamate dehydrogenase [Hyphomicrobiales bacterium]OJU03138.1 MAG: NAD-glutamate dehydrogenase [Rhizobiales bacterium 65-79]
MAKVNQQAQADKKAAKSDPGPKTVGEGERFAKLLLAGAAEEDIAPYDRGVLKEAASLAWHALKKHRSGASVVAVDNDHRMVRDGRPLTAVTVVNDNMPFLFDSVLGEIADSAGSPTLVTHPIIAVRHGRGGVSGLAEGLKDKSADKVSVIHVHVARLGDEAATALEKRLERILSQVRAAVHDWRAMLARLDQAILDYRYSDTHLDKDAVTEAVAFLEWLRDNNFTFLGMREYRYAPSARGGGMERADKPGIGILGDPDVRILRRGGQELTTTPEIRAFLTGPEPLIVTKANTRSVVHRRNYLDYIGVKTFDGKGRLKGELRIVGLFTSTAYLRSVFSIPYLRSKADAVLRRSGFEAADHSGKALINILESYPRDELFQIDIDTLQHNALAILALGDRPRVRALVRADPFDRFVSVIVYVPRDNYDSDVRVRIGEYLKTAFDGHLSAYYPSFPEGALARVHFIIGRSEGKTPKVPQEELEAAIRTIVRTWQDALRDAAHDESADPALIAVASHFPDSYRGSFSPTVALRDAAEIRRITEENPIAVDFHRHPHQADTQGALKIYHFGKPLALSRRVPILENMGFRVISERTFEIPTAGGALVFVHDMELESAHGEKLDLADGGALFAEVFLSVWRGRSDNDGYNALAHRAGFSSADIMILRAYGHYLQQAGIPQSQDYIAAVLARHPAIARNLRELFNARLDPSRVDAAGKNEDARSIEIQIETALDDVPNIDEDTIIRRFLNLVHNTLRTNHFAPVTDGNPRSLAVKLDSKALDGLPEPRPWREIFVFGPEVEGVHLRFGPVARGGLRWSDRAQDYRTEVLGLVKAQQVKNAVIVPVGAKGGFYPKQLPAGGSRDAVFEAGRHAYINYVSSLLSVTDNLHGARVVPPADIVRHDGDDPYFVVAADKGTATFSDTANAISQAHDFWLDDAFASGGSAGYDHKKMGITARGAWEAVKRHFREMNRDIQKEPFTVVGVGDMSGDVFGNGMLLSKETRLIAAFDHRDIFIDPDPDPVTSFAERQRMFNLPRSSWQDYDKSKISAGGGVFPRTQKSITLSEAAASAIGLKKTTATPTEIMNAILKARVDLLWFGGIGTYVRAATESNQDVGDRANDAIRVTAAEVRASVIGEGANLGVTQRGRIEYGLLGGRCNSDAIDNSAGVNSSDMEVNIKIALAAAMRRKKLTRVARNVLLVEMTEDVASHVLANNYQQTLALSMSQRRGLADLAYQRRFISGLEARGLLDRKVELLPDDSALSEREAKGQPLTRAELGVLLAYAKLTLFDDLVKGSLPDDPYLEHELTAYFPHRMAKEFPAEISAHRLRREIIATRLANDIINRGGPAFVTRLKDLTGQTDEAVGKAFVLVQEGYDLNRLYAEIDALDNKVDGAAQLGFYAIVAHLLETVTSWLLKNGDEKADLSTRIARLREARAALEPELPRIMPAFMLASLEERSRGLQEAGAPDKLAAELALLGVTALVPDIAYVASRSGADITAAARAFFTVSDIFRVGRIEEAAQALPTTDYYDRMALERATDALGRARRDICASALAANGKDRDPVRAWMGAGGERIQRTRDRLQALTEGGEVTVSKLSVASGLMTDLAGL